MLVPSALRRSAWIWGCEGLTEAREDQYQGGEHTLCGPEDQGQGVRDAHELHHVGRSDGEMHSTERFLETKKEQRLGKFERRK